MNEFTETFWFAPVITFIACAVLVRILRSWAFSAGLVDNPGGRKRHDGAIPLVGGLAIFPVFIAISVYGGHDISQFWPLYSALTLLLACGAWDDAREIRPWIKFGAQWIAAILIVVPGGAELKGLGNIFSMGNVGLDILSIPFSVVAVVLLINAINLMDGLDGLAGGVSFIALGFFAAAFSMAGQSSNLLYIMLGALAAFLFYNVRTPIHKRASIFLGDAGSMCLGLIIAWFAITSAENPALNLEPISVAWILALPIIDICAQFARRMSEGNHPFTPDRGHFHHHFIDAGLTGGKASAIIFIICIIFGSYGLFAQKYGWPNVMLTLDWIALILLHIWMSLKTERYVRLIEKMKHLISK